MVQGIGERLKQLRKASHLSQRELSGKLGMSQSLLSSLENNKLDLSLDTFLRVCQFFDVTSEWMLYGKGKAMKRGEAAGMTPLIDQRASAGYVKEGTEISDDIAYYTIPGFSSKKESRLFEVKGDPNAPQPRRG